MTIPIFLSRAEAHRTGQQAFLDRLTDYLCERDLEPRVAGDTDFVGVTVFDIIRSAMMQCNGILTVALRRTLIQKGVDRPDCEFKPVQQLEIAPGTWLTTPYCHIETAMAYQLGLPVLVIVECGVLLQGALEDGVLVKYPPTCDLESPDGVTRFFSDRKWRQLSATWEGQVREVARNRACPPVLYGR